MAAKYYAVKKGLTPGIYRSWDECKKQVDGYSGASYKSFKTEHEALEYMGLAACGKICHKEKGDAVGSAEAAVDADVIAYVDGSYNVATGEYSYGMVILRDGNEYTFNLIMNDPEMALMRNVAGEIEGAKAAMQYALDNNINSIAIYHDYEGIAKWCTGEWRANKPGTIAYRDYYKKVSEIVDISFVKVAGHSNDKYNDIADALAKEALGIQ